MHSPSTSAVEATRPDDAAEAIRRGFGYHTAFSAGELSYRQRVIVGDTVSVSDLHLGAELHVDLDPMHEIMLVHLHEGRYAYDPWGVDRVFSAGETLVMPPGQTLHFDIDHADVSTCSFSVETLQRAAREVFDLDDAILSEGAVRPLDPAHAWLWQQTVARYRRGILEDADAYGNDLLRDEASRYLVVNAISAFGLIDQPQRHASGNAAIRRALRFIDEHLQTPLTVQDIASAARLSPRGLSLAFQRERGQSPMEYVRAGRLAGARAALIAADPTTGDNVARVAAAWGFTNAGRFSAQYRETFGESPRTTLAR